MNRRKLLALAAALAAATARPLAAAALARNPDRLARTRPAMGTLVTVTCLAPSRNQAEQAVEAAFAEVAAQEKIYSRHDPNSPLGVLNSHGAVDAPPELGDLVLQAKAVHRLTAGAFDPTVLPLMRAVTRAARQGTILSGKDPELKEAARLCDPAKVLVRPGRLSLAEPGMGLTLDSIAKGRVLDKAAQAVERQGVATLLIEAGGDVLAKTGPDAPRPWRVALANPAPGADRPATTTLRNGALATSGGYETAMGPRKQTHHIVSPATLASPNALAQATIFAPTAEEADALATAVFVMGPKQGMELIAALPGRECLLITRAGARIATPNFPA